MKYLLAATISAVGLIGLNSALAKGGGNSSSNSAPPAPAHRGGSAPVTAPIGGGVPHNLSGPGTYRPLTVYRNGQRALVYPGVRNSAVHHPTNSNLVSSGAMQRTGGNLRSSSTVASVTKTKLDPLTSARLRNWKGNVSSTGQAHLNNANNHHHHHDHDWWKDHCLAFIFFDWGWWGWYDGWWYPAWGYDPYSYYEYNEPIYASNGLTPDQIVAGVQAKLQQLGYYTYAIDGKMGPLTQSAIARYQRDNHMSITSGMDSATLGSLGIIH
jgi:Putative peptidoglycan binding domain